jgi:hypothetical protein
LGGQGENTAAAIWVTVFEGVVVAIAVGVEGLRILESVGGPILGERVNASEATQVGSEISRFEEGQARLGILFLPAELVVHGQGGL